MGNHAVICTAAVNKRKFRLIHHSYRQLESIDISIARFEFKRASANEYKRLQFTVLKEVQNIGARVFADSRLNPKLICSFRVNLRISRMSIIEFEGTAWSESITETPYHRP